MSFHVPETLREEYPKEHPLYSSKQDGNNGVFNLGRGMMCLASDGAGWEHVSVSFQNHTPTWDDMAGVKKIFWDEEDCVVQYHPPRSAHVNYHPFCLHLWRPIDQTIPMPPTILVGPM